MTTDQQLITFSNLLSTIIWTASRLRSAPIPPLDLKHTINSLRECGDELDRVLDTFEQHP